MTVPVIFFLLNNIIKCISELTYYVKSHCELNLTGEKYFTNDMILKLFIGYDVIWPGKQELWKWPLCLGTEILSQLKWDSLLVSHNLHNLIWFHSFIVLINGVTAVAHDLFFCGVTAASSLLGAGTWSSTSTTSILTLVWCLCFLMPRPSALLLQYISAESWITKDLSSALDFSERQFYTYACTGFKDVC